MMIAISNGNKRLVILLSSHPLMKDYDVTGLNTAHITFRAGMKMTPTGRKNFSELKGIVQKECQKRKRMEVE